MAVALHPDLPHDLLAHLMVADIAPSKGALSPEFQGYVEAMKKIEESKVTTRKDAQHILSSYEPVGLPQCVIARMLITGQDAMVRAFLLTNLLPAVHDNHNHPVKFRVPIDIIGGAISAIGDFAHAPGEQEWDGPTLFIKGTKSK